MDSRIYNVLNYIEDNLSNKLSLEKLASVGCMSTGYFHRVFKKETGRTPFDFIEEIKMNKAYALILSESYRIHKLSEMFGYNDYETFSRAFKKHFTLAPDDIRAIALRIKKDMNLGSDGLLIKIYEVDDLSKIQDKLDSVYLDLKELILQKGYTEADIDKGKVLSIVPKINTLTPEDKVVKNKYVIREDQKIWESILKQYKNDNT